MFYRTYVWYEILLLLCCPNPILRSGQKEVEMLVELYVSNLAVIEDMRLEFRRGLTVLSGEEGAGKSLLIDALSLLVGGKASTNLIRNGASTALVEGVFWPPGDEKSFVEILEEAGIKPENDGSIIMAREIREHGRSVARVNGRAVSISLLQELGEVLIDLHSQMEHVSLLKPRRQLDLLDAFGSLMELRSDLGVRITELRRIGRELNGNDNLSSERHRELLEYQVSEIENAGITIGEDEALEQERLVLQRAEVLKSECYGAYSALYDNDLSAAGLVRQAAAALRGIVAIDPALAPHLETLESAAGDIEDTARELRIYADSVDSRAGQLVEVEARLELLRHLKSKYGLTLPDILDFYDRTRAELEALVTKGERQCCLVEELQMKEKEAGRVAQQLSNARKEAARTLTELINGELADLGMPRAQFDIRLNWEPCDGGLPADDGRYTCSQHGFDRVEFLGATNPGEPLRPLGNIASGGETCRFMLAVKSALQKADPVPTLVFDEIDSGIGGRNAHTVGNKLSALAQHRQVICITHLPHIACYGSQHYRVVKDISSGRAVTRAECLQGDSRLEELAAMMGSSADDLMLETARELLAGAEKDESRCASAAV